MTSEQYYGETLHVRPRPIPLIILFVVFIIVDVLNYRNSHDRNLLFILAAMVVIGILLALVFMKASITIDGNDLVYKNIFRTKNISLPTTKKTYIKWHRRGKASSYFWHFETADQIHEKFSIRFYSRRSLGMLSRAIMEKCRSAEIDPMIQNMSEGHFPWRIF